MSNAGEVSMKPSVSIIACAGLLLGAAVSTISAARLFDTSTTFVTGSYPEGFYPHASRVADINDDGKPDYVASNHWFSNNVSVMLHDDAAGYLAPSFLTIDLSSIGVEVADFTGDGLPDILASNTGSNYQGSTVSLLRNLGGGAFAPRQTFAAVAGPTEIVAADFDGDGDTDAAVAGYGPSGQGTRIAILRNNGLGGFLAPTLITVGIGPSDLEAGDLNGDGRPDLVVARDTFKLTVLLNTGNGTFATPVDYVTQDQQWAGDFFANTELSDVDRDGDLDVYCSSTRTQIDADYGAICVLRNQGDGTLGNRSYVVLPRYLGGAVDIAVADVTNDTWPDLLTAHAGNGGWVVTPSLGGGAFGPGLEYAGGNDPMKVAAADADADGDLDALVLNRYSLTLGVHLNRGNGTFLEPGGRDLEPLCGWMDAGDIDGDGDLDVVSSFAYAGGGGLSLIRNNADGTFAPRQNYTGPRGAMTPRFDDLDGDLDLDLVWAFDPTSPPYDFAVRLNDGSGNFGAPTSWQVGTCGTGDLITMDVDQDGDRDVLLTDWLGCGGIDSPWVWIRRNNGDATFGPPYRLVYVTDPKEMDAADFDGDGEDDLATLHADGIKLVHPIGDGLFGPPTEYPVPDPPYGLVAADFDGDGFPDIATANIRGAWEGTISIFMNDGTGILGVPSTIRSAFSTEVSPIGQILAEDADLDGDRDLLLMSYGGQDLLVYENDGQGGFALQGRYVVGAAPGDFRCLDFTGDGKPDFGAVIGLPPANLNKRFVVAVGIQTDPAAVVEAGTTSPTALVSHGPNPFRDFTRVGFRLPARTPVRLAAYDVAGREVASLLDGALGAGEHLVTWDGAGRSGARLAAGVYLMRLITDGGTASLRLVVMP
jgi:hypothetical protein